MFFQNRHINLYAQKPDMVLTSLTINSASYHTLPNLIFTKATDNIDQTKPGFLRFDKKTSQENHLRSIRSTNFKYETIF